MASFTKASVENLKNQVNIVDVVGRAVKLKRAGSYFKGLCPFHNEKTPSFTVSDTRQYFTCFGCGARGDVIEFMMRYYNLGFGEAVEKLAEEYGVKLERRSGYRDQNLKEYYDVNQLKKIILNSAARLGVEVEDEAAKEMARRSRGTPRLANRVLKRVRDYAEVRFDGTVTEAVAKEALDMMDVDRMGLDHVDRRYLSTIITKFGGGPVGVETLAAAIGEDPGTLEDVVEPYLLQNGF
uniref:CHC2 zinc finger domain-containing protein n=1 Tax=Eubacterium pyruvativorans TaxID=155865 RepID=UPI0023F51938